VFKSLIFVIAVRFRLKCADVADGVIRAYMSRQIKNDSAKNEGQKQKKKKQCIKNE
jgi:hypothetical protein